MSMIYLILRFGFKNALDLLRAKLLKTFCLRSPVWHAVIVITKRQSETKSYLYDVTASISSME